MAEIDSSPTKGKAGWTETEKLNILFQIIEKCGKIEWSAIDLPEGRTLKAVQVMVDKEKAKVRKAKGGGEASSSVATPTKKTPKAVSPKKRSATAADDDDDDDDDYDDGAGQSSTPKKQRTPRKKPVKQEKPSGDDVGADEFDMKEEDTQDNVLSYM